MTYSRFRNAVFHVPDDRTDYFKADEEFHSKSPSLSDYRGIIDGLFKFYLSNPADTSAAVQVVRQETPEDGHLNDGG